MSRSKEARRSAEESPAKEEAVDRRFFAVGAPPSQSVEGADSRKAEEAAAQPESRRRRPRRRRRRPTRGLPADDGR